jgi:hypothetical protein
MVKYSHYLFFLFLLMFGCEKDEKDPLYQKLVGTTWVMDRVEVVGKNGLLISAFEATFPNPPNNESACTKKVLNFRNDQLLVIGSSCKQSGSGCGQYLFSNGTISFSILDGQAVTGICQASNFASILAEKSKTVLLEDNTLRIDGWFSSFFRLSAEPNGMELLNLYDSDQIEIRTYYKPTEQVLVSDLACCGNLSLIP